MLIDDRSADLCSAELAPPPSAPRPFEISARARPAITDSASHVKSSNPILPLTIPRDSARSIARPARSASTTSGPPSSARSAAMSRRNAPVSARTAPTISSISSIGKSLHHSRHPRTLETFRVLPSDPPRQHRPTLHLRPPPDTTRPPPPPHPQHPPP